MPYYYGYGYGYISYLIFMLPAILLSVIAQIMVKSSYSKYSKIENSRRLTGYDAAQRVLSAHGIRNVRIEAVSGTMTDHYSPNENVIRLSEGVYGRASIAAVCIAAHEAGHAVQHAEGYMPNKIRSALIPVSRVTSNLAFPLILIGLIFQSEMFSFLLIIGIVLYSFAVLVYIVTLPVEFDASRRALAAIKSTDMLDSREYGGAKKVLTAAALTYVASALSALLTLLRYILIAMSRSSRRR